MDKGNAADSKYRHFQNETKMRESRANESASRVRNLRRYGQMNVGKMSVETQRQRDYLVKETRAQANRRLASEHRADTIRYESVSALAKKYGAEANRNYQKYYNHTLKGITEKKC